jgi:hypothetical protein
MNTPMMVEAASSWIVAYLEVALLRMTILLHGSQEGYPLLWQLLFLHGSFDYALCASLRMTFKVE